jgi:hypothetical protein
MTGPTRPSSRKRDLCQAAQGFNARPCVSEVKAVLLSALSKENFLKHAALRRYFRHGTLTQLAVFDAVARHQSFTRAGEELCLAQPTVSVQMKKLAQTVGMPLFLQKGRQMELTDAGRELHGAIDGMFTRLSQLEDRIAPLRPAASAPLSSHGPRLRPGQAKGAELRKIG